VEKMARDKQWEKAWNGHIEALSLLRWIPNLEDSQRIQAIQEELKEIVKKNKEV